MSRSVLLSLLLYESYKNYYKGAPDSALGGPAQAVMKLGLNWAFGLGLGFTTPKPGPKPIKSPCLGSGWVGLKLGRVGPGPGSRAQPSTTLLRCNFVSYDRA